MTNGNSFAFGGYAKHYSDKSLQNKLKKVARKLGRKAVYYVLVLYYVAKDPSVPTSLKIKVFGALGYFILPFDLIPDAIIGLGFTDDILALAWAFMTMRKYITPEIKKKARDRVRQWFGDEDGGVKQDITTWNLNSDDPRIIDVEAEEY